MPFQLYPQLPAGHSNEGVAKDEIFQSLLAERAPDMTDEQKLARVGPLAAAWRAEGLCLRSPPTGLNEQGGGRMGSSFDAQRLIMLARSQGHEDAMIEEVYTANHSRDECLSDWSVLLGCARRAGVTGAEKALHSGWGVRETLAKIEEYKSMGVTAVPVVVIDSIDSTPIKAVLSSGAPELDYLQACFAHLIEHGRLPWAAEAQPLPSPQPAGTWMAGLKSASPHHPPREPPQSSQPAAPTPPPSTTQPLKQAGGAMSRVLDMLGSSRSGATDGGGPAVAGGCLPAFGMPASAVGNKVGVGASTQRVTHVEPVAAPSGFGRKLDAGKPKCENGTCPLPLAQTDGNGTRQVNRLKGSLRCSKERPHAMQIDADFVTCTQ